MTSGLTLTSTGSLISHFSCLHVCGRWRETNTDTNWATEALYYTILSYTIPYYTILYYTKNLNVKMCLLHAHWTFEPGFLKSVYLCILFTPVYPANVETLWITSLFWYTGQQLPCCMLENNQSYSILMLVTCLASVDLQASKWTVYWNMTSWWLIVHCDVCKWCYHSYN